MSILLGLHEERSVKEDEEEEEGLFVFGYGCKLYHDDVKAVMEGSGQLLIPWMGDSSLMVDRYDVRNKLEDKSQFGLKPNLPRPMSAEELALEEELDKERYLALEWDDIRVEEQEEEERRRKESGFAAIGFTYGNSAPAVEQPQQHAEVSSNLSLPEHPPTSCVDCDDEDPFVPPPGLLIPEGIQAPATNKLHSIIEKTASFIAKQGNQMEIIIKTKQKFNPFFSFLNYKDKLFPYYTHLKDMIVTGGYAPQTVPDMARNGSMTTPRKTKEVAAVRNGTSEQKRVAKEVNLPKRESPKKKLEVDTDSDSDDSDSDDGGYLHPLLTKGSLKASKPSTPQPPPSSSAASSQAPPTLNASSGKLLSVEELMNMHSKSSFVARSLAINSAPSLNQVDVATHGQPTPSHHTTYSEADAMAAYEQYKQQYYDSSSGGGDLDASFGYYPPDPSLSPHDAYNQHPYPPGAGAPYSDHYPPYYGHFPHPIPPPDLRPVIDKTAEYVAKNSDNFERTILERHIGDVRFNFLNPWDQYHNYYQAMKQYNRTRLDQEQSWGGGAALNPLPPMPLLASAQQEEEVLRMKPNVQKLSSSGAVSFKLQSKAPPSSAGPLAPEFAPLEESPEPGEPAQEEEEDSSDQPPPKKPRLENGDHIENAVQDFLSMVKGEVGGDEEGMGSTVEAFLSTVKGMFGADSSN